VRHPRVSNDSSVYSSRTHPSMHVSRGNAASLRDFESFVILQLVEPISLLSSRNFDTRFPALGGTSLADTRKIIICETDRLARRLRALLSATRLDNVRFSIAESSRLRDLRGALPLTSFDNSSSTAICSRMTILARCSRSGRLIIAYLNSAETCRKRRARRRIPARC